MKRSICILLLLVIVVGVGGSAFGQSPFEQEVALDDVHGWCEYRSPCDSSWIFRPTGLCQNGDRLRVVGTVIGDVNGGFFDRVTVFSPVYDENGIRLTAPFTPRTVSRSRFGRTVMYFSRPVVWQEQSLEVWMIVVNADSDPVAAQRFFIQWRPEQFDPPPPCPAPGG